MNQSRNPTPYLVFSLLLIILDQLSKFLVYKYMEPGFSGQIPLIGNWLKLHYVLNPGMAFGMQLGHEYGKLFLTLFRLVAMAAIGWYLIHLARSGASKGLLWALAMILAGAVGNVIDSTFYGVLLKNAPYGSPTPWFHGQVIDMIFVDFWEGFIPDWVPVWGGQYYSTPIFNIADSCIFIGVCSILIFQGSFHANDHKDEDHNAPEHNPDPEHFNTPEQISGPEHRSDPEHITEPTDNIAANTDHYGVIESPNNHPISSPDEPAPIPSSSVKLEDDETKKES